MERKMRMEILRAIEAGEISVEEGLQRLEEAMESGGEPPQEPSPATERRTPASVMERPPMARVLTYVVLGLGTAIVTGGGLLLAAVYAWSVARGWLFAAWPLFGLGVLFLLAAGWMWQARWFYVRVRERGGHRFTLAFPLPLRLMRWLTRVAKPFSRQLQEHDFDELLGAMEEELQRGEMVVVEVDDEEDGDQVELVVG